MINDHLNMQKIDKNNRALFYEHFFRQQLASEWEVEPGIRRSVASKAHLVTVEDQFGSWRPLHSNMKSKAVVYHS